MKRKFNITGTCLPHLHYMMDHSEKLAGVMKMVESGEYFTINRPRQYGKTTTMAALETVLNQQGEYRAFFLSFEGVGDTVFQTESGFCAMFLRQLARYVSLWQPELGQWLKEQIPHTPELDDMSLVLSDFVQRCEQPVVLFIDEVDKTSNNQLFLSFLGMLRTKYLERHRFPTFHSVALAGVHDIKTLKAKLRPGETAQYNSPWNIAADFKVEMSFAPHEIAPMLVQYSEAEQVEIDIAWFAERLYYYTSGYPFLVSKLCKTIAEDILPPKTERRWSEDDLEEAVQLLLRENNTLFDSLIKYLENDPDLYRLTQEIIINGATIPFNPDEPVISLGRLYGIFRLNGSVNVHNRIFEQRLYNYMVSKMYQAKLSMQQTHLPLSYEKPDGSLDLESALLRFQQFLREQYSAKDERFLERQWRLIFLAFFKPILNGKGHDFKEVQISEERRLDVVVTYLRHRYIIELKRWYGPSYHQKGLDQLADYLDRQGVSEGYLVIFEGTQAKSRRQEWIEHGGKRVFAVWV